MTYRKAVSQKFFSQIILVTVTVIKKGKSCLSKSPTPLTYYMGSLCDSCGSECCYHTICTSSLPLLQLLRGVLA